MANLGRREDHADIKEVPSRQRSRQRMTSIRDGEHGDHNGGRGDHDVAGTDGMHQQQRKNTAAVRNVGGRGDHHHHVAGGGVHQKQQHDSDSGIFSDGPIDYDISEDQGPTSAVAVGEDQDPVVRWR